LGVCSEVLRTPLSWLKPNPRIPYAHAYYHPMGRGTTISVAKVPGTHLREEALFSGPIEARRLNDLAARASEACDQGMNQGLAFIFDLPIEEVNRLSGGPNTKLFGQTTR
jgi:hypothetical protein